MPGFEYQWQECTKTLLGFCREWTARIEYYDLRDEKTRDQLIAMDFVAHVREKVTP